MINLFNRVSEECSKITTEAYSTSFSSAIKLLHKSIQPHIHNIYGFVRFADEIVDTFHEHDKALLLKEFKVETLKAIERKISLNPVLNSFQHTANMFEIDTDLIEAFFYSMESDLEKQTYNIQGYNEYVYGSSEAVGLMCLHVFCEGNMEQFQKLKAPAQSLGAAFQKVNFLRDLSADYLQLKRTYFPGCDINNFSSSDKKLIEEDIQNDFDKAYKGILQLPVKAKFGVYVAYVYYLSLFKKIKKVQPKRIFASRIRIPDYGKLFIIAKAGVKNQLNII